MNLLVTGVAGFIGAHVAQRLLARGDRVVGIDNLNDYYPVTRRFMGRWTLRRPNLLPPHVDRARPQPSRR